MAMQHPGKLALVTGASSGIGWHIADQLAAEGWDILSVSNQGGRLKELKENLERNHGIAVTILDMDLAREEAARELYRYCRENGLEVELLVNNAGMFFFSEMVEADVLSARAILQLHVTTPALLCRLFGGDMKARGSGYILNMSSISAVMPYPTISMYAPTKTFLRHFSRAIRTELKPYGVQVTCLIPGATKTGLYAGMPQVNAMVAGGGGAREPAWVARKGLQGLFRGKAEVVPGLLNRVVMRLAPLVPHSLISYLFRRYFMKPVVITKNHP